MYQQISSYVCVVVARRARKKLITGSSVTTDFRYVAKHKHENGAATRHTQTQKVEKHFTAKMGRGRLQEKRTDRKFEEEEKDSEEEQHLQKNLSEPNLDELFNIEEKPAAVPKSLQKVPRKALSNQIAEGKSAKPKSNIAQVDNRPRLNATKSTSSDLQKEKKSSGKLNKAPDHLAAHNPKAASGPSNIAANIQREEKQTNKKSVALAYKQKGTAAKRTNQEELPFNKRKKSEEDDDPFRNIFENVYSQDNLDTYLGEEVATVDDLIAKAERTVLVLPDELDENNPPTEEDKDYMKRIVVYVTTLAKAQQKANEAGNEPRIRSPLWGTEKEGSLAILHALQNINMLVGDLLASIEMHEKSDGDEIMKMLSIYAGKSKMRTTNFFANNY